MEITVSKSSSGKYMIQFENLTGSINYNEMWVANENSLTLYFREREFREFFKKLEPYARKNGERG